MDWKECITNRIVKDISIDLHKIRSIRLIAHEKLKASSSLDDTLYYAKLPLLYDVLRELLECIALQRKYKIYNHECYTAFLKEILHLSHLGDRFDRFRVLRNGINYYGKQITLEEAKTVMQEMRDFIKTVQKLIDGAEK